MKKTNVYIYMKKTNIIKGHKTKSKPRERYTTFLDGKMEYHKIINSPKRNM